MQTNAVKKIPWCRIQSEIHYLARREKQERRRERNSKIGITLSYPVPHELLTPELLCVFTPSSSLFTTGKSQ
jgi:hypothetical protein